MYTRFLPRPAKKESNIPKLEARNPAIFDTIWWDDGMIVPLSDGSIIILID